MNNIPATNNTTKYYLYMNRAYKSADELFIVTELPLPMQNPILMSEDRAEIDGICGRFNVILKNSIDEVEKDKKTTFFLTKMN